MREIVLPDTKPYLEWIDGKAVAKMSPAYSHSLVQSRLIARLLEWSEQTGYGRVGTEWRFRMAPPGEIIRPLLPDVAYLSFEALGSDASEEDVEMPLAAPTVAFEVRSKGDREKQLASKVRTYLASGTAVVYVVAPRERLVHVHEPSGTTTLTADAILEHPALPEFRLELAALFAPTPVRKA